MGPGARLDSRSDGRCAADQPAHPESSPYPDPTNLADLALPTKDLCQIGPLGLPSGLAITGLAGVCRPDPQTGTPMYRINLVDDMDEPPPNANPFQDQNNVFMIRAECVRPSMEVQVTANGTRRQDTDVVLVEVNQSGLASCYGPGNPAGCGGAG